MIFQERVYVMIEFTAFPFEFAVAMESNISTRALVFWKWTFEKENKSVLLFQKAIFSSLKVSKPELEE